ncbi:Tic22-like family [Musa troglodytarum]|uniref:Tic22-like family n=1 Tax=Musa troglodytarum TaxID=320322 RepID=A0A9E7GNI2_9LILI|nr:Tic22-like family [Musa troglodytarum]
MMDEMRQHGIPLSVMSTIAEIQSLDVVDKVLENECLRKTSGIQPKFPHLVNSFEERVDIRLVRERDLGGDAWLYNSKSLMSFCFRCCPERTFTDPLLPKITMVGVSMGDGQMTKANLKKTMKHLTKGLEQANHQ